MYGVGHVWGGFLIGNEARSAVAHWPHAHSYAIIHTEVAAGPA